MKSAKGLAILLNGEFPPVEQFSIFCESLCARESAAKSQNIVPAAKAQLAPEKLKPFRRLTSALLPIHTRRSKAPPARKGSCVFPKPPTMHDEIKVKLREISAGKKGFLKSSHHSSYEYRCRRHRASRAAETDHGKRIE